MSFTGIRVKVKDVSNSYVSFKYLTSNAHSRIKKADFLKGMDKGEYNVVNPEALDK